jgi:hypothetical protein
MTSPLEKVRALYGPESPRAFEEDLTAHMNHGYVYSTPEYLLMARPVSSKAPQEIINDVWTVFPLHACDAWYVYAFAVAHDRGLADFLNKLLRHIPFFLPLLAWERSGQPLEFFPTNQLIQKYAKLSLVED